MSNRVVSWKLWVSSLWQLWRTQDGMADPARLMKLFSYIFQETYACYICFLHFLSMSLRLKDLSHDLIFRVSKRSKCLNCLVAIGLGEGPMSPNEFKWASVFSVVPENVNPETCPNEYAWCVMMHHDAWFCMMASSNVFHPFRYFFFRQTAWYRGLYWARYWPARVSTNKKRQDSVWWCLSSFFSTWLPSWLDFFCTQERFA